MKHNIDRIIAACDQAIAKAEEDAAKQHEAALTTKTATDRKTVQRRKRAATAFAEIAAALADGGHLSARQKHFLYDLHGFYGSDRAIKLHHLTDDLSVAPKRNAHPAPSYVYDLRKAMVNLRRDNDGATTVSTSFLKDLGFGSTVIIWVARV